MNFSLPNRLYIGFSVSILLVILSGLLSYRTFQRQSEAGEWVKHTYQVLNQAKTIEKLIADMETGRIRYRSTGVEQFLKPYKDARRNIKPAINELKVLTADNPAQVRRVSRIYANVETLLLFWNKQKNSTISQYKQEEFIDLIVRQKAFSDKIRNDLNDVINAERLLLTQRENKNQESVRQATYELLLSTLLTLFIVLSLIYFTIKEFNSNRKAQATLQDNYKELEHLNQLSTHKNWLLSGLAVINDGLQHATDATTLAQSILSVTAGYLDLLAGAFYCFSEKDQNLRLNASVALPDGSKKTYKLGEGLVGQAATERSLTIVNDIPLSFWELQAGSSQRPGQVVFLPLWYNKDLKGVMEFASFRPLSEQALLLLKSVANNIAVAINAAEDHEKVLTLLQQVQEQKEELESQQEVLQQSNSELTRQAEVLQVSERELLVQEEELRQMNSELLERNKAVENARKELANKALELEASSKFKSEFLANMSHELRTPLNSVLILARLLAENKQINLTDKQIQYANIIHKSGSDLLELINDILDLSKIEAGKIDLLFDRAVVRDIAADMHQLFSVVADEKDVALSITIANDVPDTIWTDRQRLEQIIKNLLSNAVKFTPKNGSVGMTVRLAAPVSRLLKLTQSPTQSILAIAVSDTGIGISPEKQQIIFEAFQQVDGSISRKFGGTGLGLSISKELIHRLGGEIKLQSAEGIGSTFTIYLPLTSFLETEPSPYRPDQPISVAANNATPDTMPSLPDDRNNLVPGDEVVLLIEDDLVFADILQEFAREKGFKTIVASRGDEGLQYARQYRPSAIILDMNLPVLDGWDLLKHLKNDTSLKHIPVHIISSADKLLSVSNDVLSYTTKPVEKNDLENVLSVIKNQLGEDGRKILVVSDYRLTAHSFGRLLNKIPNKLDCTYAKSQEEALLAISQQQFNCIVVDIGQPIRQGIQDLQMLHKTASNPRVQFISYFDQDVSVGEEQQLRQLSNLLIRDSSFSKNRLADELNLFFQGVQQLIPDESIPTPPLPTVRPPVPPVLIAPAAASSQQKDMRGKKVLLVDDDMRNVFALSTLLEASEMTVVTAGDGQEALDQLNEHPDTALVLMDIMMPEMDGYEATRRIRTDSRFLTLPVIALTAKAMTGDREKCLEAGASDYITKPVNSGQLFSLMRTWLIDEL